LQVALLAMNETPLQAQSLTQCWGQIGFGQSMNMCSRANARQVIAQRLHAVTLGGVVAGGDEADVVFPRAVEGLLGGFAAQVQIDARRIA
jgi:hypothetical protein